MLTKSFDLFFLFVTFEMSFWNLKIERDESHKNKIDVQISKREKKS